MFWNNRKSLLCVTDARKQDFSHDLLRIDCRKPDEAGYIYAFLKSKIGNKILLTNSYGAVITHIEPEHLATVPIPDAPTMLKRKSTI